MRNFFKLFLLTAILVLSFSFDADAKRYPVNFDIVSDDGCQWHVEGWVDVTIGWNLSVELNGYNVNVSGPCGNYNFVGIAVTDGNGNSDPNYPAYKISISNNLEGPQDPMSVLSKNAIHTSLFEYSMNLEL